MKKINYHHVGYFLLINFGLCWSIAFGYTLNGGSLSSPWFTLVALSCMFTPAIAAVIAQKWIKRAPLAELGLTFTFNRWIVAAAVLPILIALFVIPVNALLPDVSIGSTLEILKSQMERAELPEAQADLSITLLERMGGWLPVLLIGVSILAALLFGPTINAVPALGEELGWRGFLQHELRPLGFWRSSLIIGLIWGIWHFPLIIAGYNYPQHPVAGVFMMTLFTAGLSPIFAYLTEKSGTVIAAAVIHGTLNAIAGLPLFFLVGGNDLLKGTTGVAGIGIILLLNAGVYHLRKNDTFIDETSTD
ncbi:MAG: CPBP family intramembrane glutamic endopeptidase [Balneolaceae bacterium]|nr:CPBP family intramembrane glutamic endopeptidase [Balneolaceae bacterium]